MSGDFRHKVDIFACDDEIECVTAYVSWLPHMLFQTTRFQNLEKLNSFVIFSVIYMDVEISNEKFEFAKVIDSRKEEKSRLKSAAVNLLLLDGGGR